MKKWLYPFHNFTNKNILLIGVSMCMFSIVLAPFLNGRFDGVLDLHFTKNVLWHQPLIDVIINILTMTLILFAFAKILNPKSRLQDVVLTAIWARILTGFPLLFNINNVVSNMEDAIMDSISNNQIIPDLTVGQLIYLSLFGILSFGLLILFFWWIWHGLSLSTNTKDHKTVFFAIISVIIAEIMSKIIILTINY